MRLIDADKLKERINGDDVDEPLTIYGVEYYIDQAPIIYQWHYLSEGDYPILQGRCLVCAKDKQGDLYVDLARYVDDVFLVYPYEVVAWMPLPEPPKEKA